MKDPPDSRGGRGSVTIHDEQALPADLDALREAAARALDLLGAPRGAALAVTLVDPERMAELKERAFGARAPTDVLAFPVDDPADPSPGPLVLGDVVLCPAVAAEQARAAGRAPGEEITYLLVHGIQHLLGRDHAEPAEERAMFAETDRIVGALASREAAR